MKNIIEFGGLNLNQTRESYLLQAFSGNEELYTFGQMHIPASRAVKAFKTDASTTFYSSEMQLQIMDKREVPIGWSQEGIMNIILC